MKKKSENRFWGIWWDIWGCFRGGLGVDFGFLRGDIGGMVVFGGGWGWLERLSPVFKLSTV